MQKKKLNVWTALLYSILISGIIAEIGYFYQVVSTPRIAPKTVSATEIIEFAPTPMPLTTGSVAPVFKGTLRRALLEINSTDQGPEAFIEELPTGKCVESYRRKIVVMTKSSANEPLCILTDKPEISFQEYAATFRIEEEGYSSEGKVFRAQIANEGVEGHIISNIYLVTGALCSADNECSPYYVLDYTSSPQTELSFAIPGHPSFVEISNFRAVD